MDKSKSITLAEHIFNSPVSKRRNIPLNKRFVLKPSDDEQSPLQRIYVGGKSGSLALKLYLVLIGRASKKPYTVDDAPASSWAELLGLEDSRGQGARRIKNALRKLQDLKFIHIEQNPGKAPTISLLSEIGDGSPYELPSDSYYRTSTNEIHEQEVYFKVSGLLLREGIFQELQGPGLVMLLILSAEQAHKKSVWFSTSRFPQRYGISSATRARGTQELIKYGVLRATSIYIDDYGRSVSMKTKRIRKRYRLVGYGVPA